MQNPSTPLRAGAVLVAAGRGERAGAGIAKQYRPLAGRPLFAHAVRLFAALDFVPWIVLVAPPGGLPEEFKPELQNLGRKIHIAEGGARRQDSVAAGLALLGSIANAAFDVALVHDVARPFADPAAIRRLAEAATQTGGGLLAARAIDTIKRAQNSPSTALASASASDNSNPPTVAETLDRNTIWLAQTPQAIRADYVPRAAAALRNPDQTFTDEAALLESWGIPVALIESSSENFKITHPTDFARAEALLSRE